MPVRRQSLFPFLVFILVFFSCNNKPNKVVRAYYYWRSDSDMERSERDFLKQNKVKKLYRKVLDVDWNDVQGAIPVATAETHYINTQLNEYDSLAIDIVPVVFITNKTFEKIDSSSIPLLAKRVLRRCLPAFDSIDVASDSDSWQSDKKTIPKEIQFDCDWTVSTAKKYFYFLQSIRSLLPNKNVLLSATIRLHQYKYPKKTGVPPVDRGMLMVYNISSITEHSPVNSIFNYEKAKAYFSANEKYALPLDIALPAFSWCIVFRHGKFYQIDNGLTKENLDTCHFLRPEKNGFYKVLQDTVYRDLFLRPGDEIKAETIGDIELEQAAKLARKAVNTDSFSVSLFELSENEIKNYSHETLEAVYYSFQ